jgi:hypothetical protein
MSTSAGTLEGSPNVDLSGGDTETEAALHSPFASHELYVGTQGSRPFDETAHGEMASPFTEAFSLSADDPDQQIGQLLLAELEDEEFAEALEALANEAASRYMSTTAAFEDGSGVPVLDATDAEQWMEAIADRADELLAELEREYAERSVESVTDDELDAALARGFPQLEGFVDPLDAQELFFGRLKKKIKKVAKAAKNVVKKGVRLASKVMPLGIIFRRLRPLIEPLLKRVLARAIGRLPRPLREPARRLAAKYGLRPSGEVLGDHANEFDEFAMEFDLQVAEAMTGGDAALANSLEPEATADARADEGEATAAQLDLARERLRRQLIEAEPGTSLETELEQFLPAAILPVVRTGIRLAGRKRVVSFVAGLLAKLIKPVIGRQLAGPLSVQIADKGLRLLSLEAEAGDVRLGPEAVVASVEDTVAEVFALPDELLENELFLEAAIQDAFHEAAARYFPGSVLRPDLVDPEDEAERGGVWVMMPRATGPVYRYRKYSRAIPVRLTRGMARNVVFSDGETLDDRISDAGEVDWPVDVEVEAYELLPGTRLGHVVPFEAESGLDAFDQFDAIEETGQLPLPQDMLRLGTPRRHRNPHLVRVRVRGRALRRRSPVALRLDLSAAEPTVRLHVWLSERRAHALVTSIERRRRRDVVSAVKAIGGRGMRRVVTKRLDRIMARRGLVRPETALAALADQLFDGLTGAVAGQIDTMAPALVAAAKDPADGLTMTAVFRFASKDAIGTRPAGTPAVTIRPGRHRD